MLRLKEWRKKNRMTLAEVAEKMGYSLNTVWRHEAGRQGVVLESLGSYASIYGCRISDLIDTNPPETTGAVSELENIFGGGNQDAVS